VKKGILLAVMLMLAAQAVPQGQGRTSDARQRRNQIRLMEGVLVQAVRLGAEEVGTELERFEPSGVTALAGTPRARGFVLDGYGVFFDVEIPALNQSVVWSVMVLQRDRQVGNALESLTTAVESMPAGPTRQQAEQALQQVARRVGPVSPRSTPAAGQPPPGQVTSATAAAVVTPPDPIALYTEAVKGTLIEAMLDHSLQMKLAPEEWLTVAARDSETPMPQAGLSDAPTIILRVKGSDLTLYHSDPARRDEIRAKVKVDAKVF
jgi:hypothetical protein